MRIKFLFVSFVSFFQLLSANTSSEEFAKFFFENLSEKNVHSLKDITQNFLENEISHCECSSDFLAQLFTATIHELENKISCNFDKSFFVDNMEEYLTKYGEKFLFDEFTKMIFLESLNEIWNHRNISINNLLNHDFFMYLIKKKGGNGWISLYGAVIMWTGGLTMLAPLPGATILGGALFTLGAGLCANESAKQIDAWTNPEDNEDPKVTLEWEY